MRAKFFGLRYVAMGLAVFFVGFVSIGNVLQTPSATIQIGTFNLEWFSDRDWETCSFAEKQNRRTNEDIQALAQFIDALDIEVLALQEIESAKALDLLLAYLPPEKYSYIISRQPDTCQRVAVLYQASEVTVDYVEEIDTSMGHWGLRDSLVVSGKVLPDGFDFTLVVVHLKAFFDLESRRTRRRQLELLGEWIADYLRNPNSDKDLILAGDFNEHLRSDKASFDLLEHGLELHLVTKDISQCVCTPPGKYYSDPIDHLVLAPDVVTEYVEGSVHYYNYFRDTRLSHRFDFSDHCVLWASFSIEDND